jgi:hypothetical protein
VRDWDSNTCKAGHLRWIKIAREHHQCVAREEKRKEEVLAIFTNLVELSSKQHLGSSDSPPQASGW